MNNLNMQLRNQIIFQIASKGVKYLWINLAKAAQDFYLLYNIVEKN